ncbi:hypothetical protein TNCV_1564811 [Trichonephila clavipes]|nr:hypothetical protein TNCV_1564811 [Trichonephila clavipes]
MNLCRTKTLPPPCFSIEVKVYWCGAVNWPQNEARQKSDLVSSQRGKRETEVGFPVTLPEYVERQYFTWTMAGAYNEDGALKVRYWCILGAENDNLKLDF